MRFCVGQAIKHSRRFTFKFPDAVDPPNTVLLGSKAFLFWSIHLSLYILIGQIPICTIHIGSTRAKIRRSKRSLEVGMYEEKASFLETHSALAND